MMTLQRGDFHTATWKRHKQDLKGRLQELRELNDRDLGETQTAETRGAIKEIKRILDLEKEASSSEVITADDLVGGGRDTSGE